MDFDIAWFYESVIPHSLTVDNNLEVFVSKKKYDVHNHIK